MLNELTRNSRTEATASCAMQMIRLSYAKASEAVTMAKPGGVHRKEIVSESESMPPPKLKGRDACAYEKYRKMRLKIKEPTAQQWVGKCQKEGTLKQFTGWVNYFGMQT